jgi:hypothetical protein
MVIPGRAEDSPEGDLQVVVSERPGSGRGSGQIRSWDPRIGENPTTTYAERETPPRAGAGSRCSPLDGPPLSNGSFGRTGSPPEVVPQAPSVYGRV